MQDTNPTDDTGRSESKTGHSVTRETRSTYDAIIVGSGPNGLAAAVRLALEGCKVLVLEAESTIGGGTRTMELIEPAHFHDVCSAVHPLGISSPFFRRLPLHEYGLEWLQPEIPVAHALTPEKSVVLERDLPSAVETLGEDGRAYYKLVHSLVENWDQFTIDALGPLRIPKNPALLASFSRNAIFSAERVSKRFKHPETRALFAGIAAHVIQPLDRPLTAAIGIVLSAAAHASGWPVAKGGSQSITNALASYLESLGGEIRTDVRVEKLFQLPDAKAVLFNLTPRQVEKIMGERLPASYRKKLQKYRYGWGSCKVDYILDEPVPWRDERLHKAGTVHIGGTFEDIAAAEQEVSLGKLPGHPYVLVAQPSVIDASRAPEGKHILWAYCHVPHASASSQREAITNQIERFAPGFRRIIHDDRVLTATGLESYNANYIGGDINGGMQDWRQFFSRPVSALSPYAIPVKGYYFCSSSTPPGGGVHGMCGFHAAEAVLTREFKLRAKDRTFRLKPD